MNKLKKINACQFTWLLWIGRSIQDLGVQCRFLDITSSNGKKILRKYAVGYCKGEALSFRAKNNEIALMCFYKDEHFWFHIRTQEFMEVFENET